MTEPAGAAHDGLVELALGLSAGPERDRTLAHVRRCPACQAELTALAGAATALWESSRPVEPPPGFEQRVLASLEPPVRRGHRGRRSLLIAAAAAVVLLAAGIGLGVGWRLADGRTDRFVSEYEETLRQLGGRALAGARLVDGDGDGGAVGRVFVYEGDSSWLFVEMEQPPGDDWSVFVDDGLVGQPDAATWAVSLDEVRADDISSVEVRDGDGRVVARAVTDD